jgi:hypothetical protein
MSVLPKHLVVAALLAAGSVSAAPVAPPVGRPIALRGTLSVVQEDDFARSRTVRIHTVFDDKTGEPFTLHFTGTPDRSLRTGARVMVRGFAVGHELHLESPGGDSIEILAASDAPAMEARRAVVLVANFSDSAVTCSDASIAGLMFTGSSSVDGLYQAASFGQVAVPSDTDGNGQPDVFRVTIPNSATEACDAYGWAAAAESAAQAAGVNLGLYQHRVIVLPGNVSCTWAGLGNVGCGTYCRAWVKTCNLQDVYAHEIGHNLDMAHASTDTNNDGTIDCEYCDQSDIMGYGGVGWRIFSAPHQDQKHWTPAGKIQEVTVAGTATFVLSPLQANPATTPYPQILKIRKSDTGDWYYLSYRQRQGYDASLGSAYVDRTSIHRYVGSGYDNTRFLAALQDAQVFDDAVNGLSVRQISHDSGSATLQITTACTGSAPLVALTPARQNARPGTELQFTATVTNRDPAMCGSSTFDLSGAGPVGFAVSLSSASLTLSPGAQGSVTLRATSSASSADGDHGLAIGVSGSSVLAHQGQAQAVYAVDGTAPSAVTTLTAALVRKGTVNLNWSAASDAGSGVASYRVFRNGSLVTSIATRTYQDRAATIAGTYDYTVVAVDAVGNVSGPGNVARITVGGSSPGPGKKH